MEVVQDHENRLAVDHRSLAILQSAMNVTSGQAVRNAKHIDYVENLIQMNSVFAPFSQEIYRMITGFEAILKYELSPHLVHSTTLKSKLLKLRERVADKGYVLGVQSLQEVYKMPTSHLVYSNGTLDLILHIPCYKNDSLLHLYEYLPSPLLHKFTPTKTIGHVTRNVETRSIAIIPKLDKTILAFNKEKQIIRTLSKAELATCQQMRNAYFCRGANYFQKNIQDDCLFNLFMGQHENIRKTCDFEVAPKRDFLTQVDGHSYLLYQHQMGKVTRQCTAESGKPSLVQLVFKGTKMLRVPNGCHVTSRNFYFEGSYELVVEPIDIHFQPFNSTLLFTQEENNIFADTKDLHLINSRKGITVKQLFSASEKLSPLWHLTLSLFSIVIIIAVLVLCLCYCRSKKFCKAHNSKKEFFDGFWKVFDKIPSVRSSTRQRTSSAEDRSYQGLRESRRRRRREQEPLTDSTRQESSIDDIQSAPEI